MLNQQDDDFLLSVRDVAKRLSLSTESVRKLEAAGELPAVTYRGLKRPLIRFWLSEVLAYQKRTTAPRKPTRLPVQRAG